MSSSLKFLCAMFLLHSLFNWESCESKLRSVQCSGAAAQEVKNSCSCTVHGVFLRSLGFSISVAVDLKLFRREVENYLVNDGQSVASNQSVKFWYAWDRAFSMSPASFSTKC